MDLREGREGGHQSRRERVSEDELDSGGMAVLCGIKREPSPPARIKPHKPFENCLLSARFERGAHAVPAAIGPPPPPAVGQGFLATRGWVFPPFVPWEGLANIVEFP